MDDPQKCIEIKIQKCVRKLKSKFTKDEYLEKYLIGFNSQILWNYQNPYTFL